MRSITHGKNTSGVTVTHISKHGLWLYTRDHEIFVAFKEFPQFYDASVRKVMKVEQPTLNFLRWPDLGINLPVESARCFPLLSKPLRPTTRARRQAKTEPITQSKRGLRSGPIRTSPKEQITIVPEIPHFPDAIGYVKGDEGGTVQSTD
jgi:hypothetical protein